MKKPYSTKNIQGPDTAARGRWTVTGPTIETLFFNDRTQAKVVERALNKAYNAGLDDDRLLRSTLSRRPV